MVEHQRRRITGAVCIPVDVERPPTLAVATGAALASQLGLGIDLLAVAGADGRGVAEQVLDRLADRLRRPDLAVERVVVDAESAAGAILEHAASRSVELVCMATRSSHGPAHLVLGSVAETVMARSPVPVLAVGPHVLEVATRYRRVVACLDGSDEAAAALAVADRLREHLGTRLDLVEVLQPAHPFPADVFESAPLRRAEERLARPADGYEVLHGDHPASTIADHLAGDPATITVVGTRGRTGWRSTLLGSVAREVAAKASGPVLVVPPGIVGDSFLADRRVGTAT